MDTLSQAAALSPAADLSTPPNKKPRSELRGDHAPWDTPPSHCLDLTNGRSKIDDFSFEQVWSYMSKPTAILKYRTEFAGDLDRQGVALSRVAQVGSNLCARLLSETNPLCLFVDPKKLEVVRKEAALLDPHFKMLTATDCQRRRKRTSHSPGYVL